MLKHVVRGLGIFFMVAGILLFVLAGQMQEELRPNRVTYGYVTGGQFTSTGSGYIGGNSEGVETMGTVKTLGGVCAVVGTGMVIASAFCNDKEVKKPEDGSLI